MTRTKLAQHAKNRDRSNIFKTKLNSTKATCLAPQMHQTHQNQPGFISFFDNDVLTKLWPFPAIRNPPRNRFLQRRSNALTIMVSATIWPLETPPNGLCVLETLVCVTFGARPARPASPAQPAQPALLVLVLVPGRVRDLALGLALALPGQVRDLALGLTSTSTSTSTGARPSTRSRTRPGTSTPRPSTRSRTWPD